MLAKASLLAASEEQGSRPECDHHANVASSDWNQRSYRTQSTISEASSIGPLEDPLTVTEVPSIITARKCVRFSVDGKGSARKQVFEYERVHDSYLAELYYSEDEIREIQQRCRDEAREYLKSNKDYRRCLKRFLDISKDIQPETVVDLIVEASKVRGLETRMTKMLTAQRKIAVLSVLDLQHRIKSMYGPQTALQRQTMLEMGLRAKSAQESRAFAQLALCMAEADAIALREC